MKLLFDENLSSRLPEVLAESYPGSVQVQVCGLGNADDSFIWRVAHPYCAKPSWVRQLRFYERAMAERPNYFWGTATSASALRLDQGKQSKSQPTRCGTASVKVMRIPCSGRKMTMGRASMVWPGTREKSYFRSKTLRIIRICSMA